MADKTRWVRESPFDMVEGEKLTFTILWQGKTSLSNPTAKVYFNRTEVTSTVMTSGNHAVSGNVQTLKRLDAQTAHINGSYVITAQVDADGNTEKIKFEARIVDERKEQ